MVKKEERKHVLLLIIGICIYMLIVIAVVRIAGVDALTQLQKRILQNVTYVVILGITLVLMKCSGNTFSQFGLFVKKMHLQIMIGAAAGAALLLFMLMLGSVPTIPEHVLYAVFSQALVGFAEETLFRGFILHTVRELTASKDIAVFLTSLFFALSHIPIHYSIAQVVVAFLVGAFFAVLRTEFEDTVGIPTLAIAHALCNIF